MGDGVRSSDDLVLEANTDATGDGDIRFITSGVERARIKSDGTGTGLLGGSQPTYTISTDGVTCFARDKNGLIVYTNSDEGAITHSLLNADLKSTAGNAVGEIVLGPGAYTRQSVPSLPPVPTGTTPDPRWLTIRWAAGARTILSAAGPRGFDYGRTNDYDWFGNYRLVDPVIDGTALSGVDTSANKGKNHVLIGTYVNGSVTSGQRINQQNILIDNPTTLGIPSDGTTVQHRRNICLLTYQPTFGEATQNYCKDVLVRRPAFSGGNAGIELAAVGTGTDMALAGINAIYDRCGVEGGWHVIGSEGSPISLPVTANIQFVSRGKGLKMWVKDFYGYGSGDVGIEVDTCDDFEAENVTIRDAAGAHFYHAYFSAPNSPDATWRLINCRALTIDQPVGAAYKWQTTSSNGLTTPIRNVELINCKHYLRRANPGSLVSVQGTDSSGSGTGTAPTGNYTTHIKIRDFEIVYDAVSFSTNSTINPMIFSHSGSGLTKLDIDGVRVKLIGTTTAAAVTFYAVVAQSANMVGRIRRIRGDLGEFTGVGGKTTWQLVQVGQTSGLVGSLSRPLRVERCGWDHAGDATSLRLLNVQSSTFLTQNGYDVIADGCDFEGLGLGWEIGVGTNALVSLEAQKAKTVLAYTSGATMKPNAFLGLKQMLSITDGVAFTIQGQGGVHGVRMRVWVTNNSGGVLGAATWSNTSFPGIAWTNPANTKSRWADFDYDPIVGKFVCTAVAPGDI